MVVELKKGERKMKEKKTKQEQKEVTKDKDDKNPFHKRRQIALGETQNPKKKGKLKWFGDEK